MKTLLLIVLLFQYETEKHYEKLDTDKNFGSIITEITITVSTSYKPEEQIDNFVKRVKKDKTTFCFNEDFCSKNFLRSTGKLLPGKSYNIKIFQITGMVTTEQCVNFLRNQKAVMLGAQGLTLAYDVAGDEFPKGKYVTSFDEKDVLWKDPKGYCRVPVVFSSYTDDFGFFLGYFGANLDNKSCILGFFENK